LFSGRRRQSRYGVDSSRMCKHINVPWPYWETFHPPPPIDCSRQSAKHVMMTSPAEPAPPVISATRCLSTDLVILPFRHPFAARQNPPMRALPRKSHPTSRRVLAAQTPPAHRLARLLSSSGHGIAPTHHPAGEVQGARRRF